MSALRFTLVLLLLSIVSSALAATYNDPQGHFRFDIPMGWKVVPTGDNGVMVVDGGSAYARVVQVPGGGKDAQLVKHVTDQIGVQWQHFTQGENGNLTFAGRHGIYVFFDGVNPKGVPAFMRVVVIPMGDDATMLIVSCPSADLNATKPAFLQMEHTFSFSPEGAAPSKKPGGDASAPEHNASKGLQSQEGPNGERILTGTLTDVTSGPTAFLAGLRQTIGYFDASPKLVSVVQSKNDRVTMATFSAVLHKDPVIAMAISTFDPAGHSRFSLLIDTPERFTQSLPSMLHHIDALTTEALESSRPSAGGSSIDLAGFEKASKQVALKRMDFSDGTASIGVAPGFTPVITSGGQFSANNAEGSYINQYVPLKMLDPRGSLYQSQVQIAHGGNPTIPGQIVIPYSADPVNAWKQFLLWNARQQHAPDPSPQIQASEAVPGMTNGWTGRMITGTLTLRGKKVVFTGTLLTSPPSQDGGWLLQISMLGAFAERASVDMPALIAMQQSEKVDLKAVAEQTMRNIQAIQERTTAWLAQNKASYDKASQERFEHSQAVAAANRDALDRSSAGFIQYIKDTAVLQHNPTGAGGTFDAELANALQKADPQNFTVLQPSQYVKGRDY